MVLSLNTESAMQTSSATRRQIAAIEARMRESEDCGGLLDELAELQAELRAAEQKRAV